jgi:hypothetical protein
MKNVLALMILSSCMMACSSIPFLKTRDDVAKQGQEQGQESSGDVQASPDMAMAHNDLATGSEYGDIPAQTTAADEYDSVQENNRVADKPMDAMPESEVSEASTTQDNSYASTEEIPTPAIEQTEVPMSKTVVRTSKVKHVAKTDRYGNHDSMPIPEKYSKKAKALTKKEKLALAKKQKAKIAKADKKAPLVCKKIDKHGKKVAKKELLACEKKVKAAKLAAAKAKAKHNRVANK